jgi:hypothetical protein
MSVKLLMNVMPANGYRFRDSDGTAFTSTGWGDLVKLVADYRRRQGKPTEGVEQEVLEQACVRNPQICMDAGPRQGKRVFMPAATPKSRAIRWLNSVSELPKPLILVLKDEADRRAGACLRCPRNVPAGVGCAACVNAMSALRAKAFPGQRMKFNPDLHVCEVLGTDLPTAVWLRDQLAVSNPDLPAHCWMKATL